MPKSAAVMQSTRSRVFICSSCAITFAHRPHAPQHDTHAQPTLAAAAPATLQLVTQTLQTSARTSTVAALHRLRSKRSKHPTRHTRVRVHQVLPRAALAETGARQHLCVTAPAMLLEAVGTVAGSPTQHRIGCLDRSYACRAVETIGPLPSLPNPLSASWGDAAGPHARCPNSAHCARP